MYTGPWVLSDDINRFEDKQIIMKYSQTKFHKKRANEWLSEEHILLGLNEYGSKYIIQQLKWPSKTNSVTETCFTNMGEEGRPKKYLGESCYRIKCAATNWTMLFSLTTILEDF